MFIIETSHLISMCDILPTLTCDDPTLSINGTHNIDCHEHSIKFSTTSRFYWTTRQADTKDRSSRMSLLDHTTSKIQMDKG
ncbi:unnamed protein product [Cylicocyclus nassatus]|uniref:Uncharacterized protein n=1 Tax=Cylicocyclus nassatus TaxID=53992 RepID=A0AA36MH50_CYLNA|nr:unnamed protein product [Cylicocyclus nassatus]